MIVKLFSQTMNIVIRRQGDYLINAVCICKKENKGEQRRTKLEDASQRRTKLGLDEESLTSREKPTDEVDKKTDIQTRSKQEQEEQKACINN
jgi:hypothetical protein